MNGWRKQKVDFALRPSLPSPPVSAPKATQPERVLVILFPQRGFWPPLTISLPLPCPPLSCPWGDLGDMVPHPAVTSQSPVFSCYRDLFVCARGAEGGGEDHHVCMPGG